ncbi:DNA-binding SARP family transcriptional activator [Spinactinospora alkalitolerans]|uniref:DNA-binding SARP family transcriptional activator n=1 Tax=Spinactinospora alkalitolerans TaxID=687207 RepID=A0A852TZR3_9ACTN|nr:BTAD domain-containing putative transcriptional regulator [Spinactinospora alkalitolerans]NYE47454.1 DNA-binding SARP family transcriptional activator [Spinactinospora alkalitolerans]
MSGEAAGAAAVAFRVLGPLEAADERGPLALKGPRHRAVLARLVIAEGRAVPVDRLVEDLWETPPDGAVAAIRTFVSGLRRALEPGRPPRRPARLLVTAPPGYALRAAPDAVDARRFEATVARSGPLLTEGRAREVPARLEEALALWRGPAYAEFTAYPWARGEIDRLDGLRLLAVERRAEALLELGRAVDAVPDLEAHTLAHPLRENAWRHLALALYRSGRQGDALSALRRARETLVTELGVDPGPELRRLETDVLAQAPHLTPRTRAVAAARPDPPQEATAPPRESASRPFVGRAQELELLEQAAAAAAQHGVTGVALVSGDAGAGKTALAETFTRGLAARGWTTAWGRSPEHDGAPAAWPWTQIADALADVAAGPDGSGGHTGSAPAADPAAARFRALREAVSLLASVADRGPVLLVFDDLHRAGEETLELLTALVTEAVPGPVLLIGTYRTGEISPALAGALARLAPREPVRVYLGGLPETATGELVRAVVHHDIDARTVHTIHRRSGGNPFFARELARLFSSEGSAALDAVPAGVRDVIRHRMAALPPSARRLLQQAAVIGRDIDPDLLASLSDDEDGLLDALDAALLAGFLTEQDTHDLRFAHVLVRDTLYEGISRPRRAHWHTAVAEAIETLRPDDVSSLAHHFGRAATCATAARAARYARAAAFQAERRFAPHEAARLWRDAVTAHDRSGDGDVRGRLEAVMGMVRALAVTGRLEAARRHRAEAVAAAEELGDPDLTAEVITAFDVPAVWTRNDDEKLARQVAEAAERTLAALPDNREEQRSRLLSTIALELRGTFTDRGRRAARRAEAIARRLGDPALLALALNARFMQSFQRAGLAPQRAETGTELVELAARHGLVTFEVLGHLILVQAHSALADFSTADAHAAAADRLGARYEIPLVGVFTQWYTALRMTAAGHPAEAEAAYRTAGTRLADSGMPGVEQGILPLALLCLRIQNGEPPPADARAAWGPYAPWARPLTSPTAAPGEAAPVPDAPPDLLNEALTCLAARAAVAVADRPSMERAYRRLLPAAGELAGAGSGLLTLGPVAHHLGDLARTLGRRAEAADHYRRALHIAAKAGAPHWATAARTALNHLD